MPVEKQMDLSVETDESGKSTKTSKDGSVKKITSHKKATKKNVKLSWPEFVKTASDSEIKERFSSEVKDIIQENKDLASNYCFISIIDLESSISNYVLDRTFNALQKYNKNKEKDILLMLLSRGGNIEPAYQISKLCKSYAKEKFISLVTRQAKSAATLVALGSDEIHMGPLGHLGPIDPQLGGLPALGVSQALQSIASMSEKYPGSSDMFAKYLRMALTVEQIGYCERISVSAEQYAERLLSTKSTLVKRAKKISKELVHEYKDHGFVIDYVEAQQHLGTDWIKTDTPELITAEKIYGLFDFVNLLLGVFKDKRLLVIGKIDEDVLIFNKHES